VAAEAYWIEASGWTLSTTTKMAYDANFRLASATVCLGDGATNAMQDSLAYVYDANGNRSGQSHYDDTRTLTETIDYTWDMTIGILARDLSVNRSLSVACRENTVYVNGASQDVIVAVFDMSGRLVQQQSLRFSGNALSMPVYAGNGNYVVRVKSANDGASVRFSLTK
jgi:YD repeat-containing protein